MSEYKCCTHDLTPSVSGLKLFGTTVNALSHAFVASSKSTKTAAEILQNLKMFTSV